MAFLFFSSTLRAEIGQVSVEWNPSPPTEAVLFSFDGADEGRGMGWPGLEEEWRDLGMSFRSPADSLMQKITLQLQKVSMPFMGDSKFNLRIYVTQALGEAPEAGELIYEGQGEIGPDENDQGQFLTLILDQPVDLLSGGLYSFVLSWEDAAPYQLLIFNVRRDYLDGQMWIRQGRDGEFTNVGQADRPGITFYVQQP